MFVDSLTRDSEFESCGTDNVLGIGINVLQDIAANESSPLSYSRHGF